MWCRISRRAASAGLKGINGVGRCSGTDIGLERVPAHDVGGTVKEASDVFFQAGIIEDGNARVGVDLEHDVNVAVGPVVAACARAKQRRPAYSARAQIAFITAQDGKRL